MYITQGVLFALCESPAERSCRDVTRKAQAMDERGSLIDEIGHLEIQLLASALPQETSSLLDYDLTLQQIRVFAHVFAARQIPITRLADMLDIRPNVATGIVQRLVERGLIERREEPSDRRVRILSVT